MTDLPLVPTINEIVYNRPTPVECRDFSFSTGAGHFLVGDIVRFFFGAVIRSGRVTNSIRRGLTQIYNIETDNHVWYRGIDTRQTLSLNSINYYEGFHK